VKRLRILCRRPHPFTAPEHRSTRTLSRGTPVLPSSISSSTSASPSGFEVGVGPSVVVVDEGKAKNVTTTTTKDDIYAFIFGQKGLMAGLGIQGNKISKTNPK
jgi:hypothetical protein